ncbi:hypothetical protein C3L33_11928, partial [Rhododendron williamsianum]
MTCINFIAEVDCSFGDSESQKEGASRKRSKSESCNASGSKACREKLRRDKFLELGSVLEPGRPPKTDKAAILSDAVRIVTQLRSEAQKLRESNEEIQERIKELKAEKNELRIEKQRLKEEKEKVEQQVKAMTAQPGFLPHPLPPCQLDMVLKGKLLITSIFPTSLDLASDRVPSPLPVSSSSMIYLPSYALGQVRYLKRTGLGAECYAAEVGGGRGRPPALLPPGRNHRDSKLPPNSESQP